MAKRSAKSESHPISLAELARRSGKQRSSITRLAQKSLRSAMLADGRIDAAHDAVAAWARGHGIDPRALTAGAALGARRRSDAQPAPTPQRRARAARAPTRASEVDDSELDALTDDGSDSPLDPATIDAVREMTLGQIADRYKTETRFADVLKNLKISEEIRYKYLDNEEQLGRLIPRDFVESRVMAAFDELFRKFLGDLPKTLTRQLFALGRANESNEKGEAFVRDSISVQIRSCKERMLHDIGAL
jgi:hypothetical protein